MLNYTDETRTLRNIANNPSHAFKSLLEKTFAGTNWLPDPDVSNESKRRLALVYLLPGRFAVLRTSDIRTNGWTTSSGLEYRSLRVGFREYLDGPTLSVHDRP